MAIDLIIQTQEHYPNLAVFSSDKGFHAPGNQVELAKKFDRCVLPKKAAVIKENKMGKVAKHLELVDQKTRRSSRVSMPWKSMD